MHRGQPLEPLKSIWLDGKLVPLEAANVPFFTHALHYGVGVFEGIRCYAQDAGGFAVFRLREHVRRLLDSARMCLIESPFDARQIEAACVSVVREAGGKECYLRPLVWIGEGAMGIGALTNPVRVAVGAFPWGAYMGEEGKTHGIRCCISSLARMTQSANLPKAKITGQYVNSVLAKRAAQLAGYDEALLLDGEGNCCEGTGENLFIVRDGVIKTPPTGASILAGITRDSILTLARERCGPTAVIRDVREERFGRDELYVADEVFLTGTAAEVTPVREIEGRAIGAGRPGPITTLLSGAFADAIRGRDGKHAGWRTHIGATPNPSEPGPQPAAAPDPAATEPGGAAGRRGSRG